MFIASPIDANRLTDWMRWFADSIDQQLKNSTQHGQDENGIEVIVGEIEAVELQKLILDNDTGKFVLQYKVTGTVVESWK